MGYDYKAYRERTKDKAAERVKKWAEENPEKIVEACKRHYAKNKEAVKKQSTEWRHAQNPSKIHLQRIKSVAKKNNIPFNIDLTDIEIPELCPVFGTPLQGDLYAPYAGHQASKNMSKPTVDRIIPSLGYVKGNVQVISWAANRLKNNGTLEQFKLIVQYLEQHQ